MDWKNAHEQSGCQGLGFFIPTVYTYILQLTCHKMLGRNR